ncbi:MAG: NAD(+) synthase [Gammaproteobacteria bacterium]|nr:NAD(+) synthase [Gammaproteobacteria bacterium]
MSVSLEDALSIDPEKEVERICHGIRQVMRTRLKKRGLVIAISGGVDSGVCAALCARALGKNKVFGLLLPEQDSSSQSVTLGRELAEHLDIEYVVEDIAPTLEAIGCYRWRDDAIRSVFSDYDGTWKNKITISGGQEGMFNHFNLVVQKPGGDIMTERMELKAYLQIVAATNYKQRIRKTIEYFHADRLNYAVIGTPNRLEFDQGFFVKNGDGSADIKPIAHLYKTQVYALARYLEIPEDIATAAPTTDTYSMDQGQDEFYFALPYDKMDIALWSYNNSVPVEDLATYLDIDVRQAQFIYDDIVSKRKTTHYLHAKPYLIDDEVLNELKML